MTIARPTSSKWRIDAPVPVGAVGTLFARLRAEARGLPIAFGIDCPIGLPRAFAALNLCVGDFPQFLRDLVDRPAFFKVAASLSDVSASSPFFPAHGTAGMTRLSHALALGLPDAAALSRVCDRATPDRPAGAPVFWTLGANQSGKAALAAWQDLLIPALQSPSPPGLWPFDGDFLQLLGSHEVAVAETYPAEAMRHLGLKMAGSKRRPADRTAYAPAIAASMARLDAQASPALAAELANGFGISGDGEDRFDSLLGVLCVLGVLQGRRTDSTPDDPWIRLWEGWVLGQTDPAMPAPSR